MDRDHRYIAQKLSGEKIIKAVGFVYTGIPVLHSRCGNTTAVDHKKGAVHTAQRPFYVKYVERIPRFVSIGDFFFSTSYYSPASGFLLQLFVFQHFAVMGRIVPFIVLLLILAAVQIIPDLRLWCMYHSLL